MWAVSLHARKLGKLQRNSEGHGILGLCNPRHLTLIIQTPLPMSLRTIWGYLSLLVIRVKPRVSQVDDSHLGPPQTLLQELGEQSRNCHYKAPG